MPPHPKPAAKPKKPGAMRAAKPKTAPAQDSEAPVKEKPKAAPAGGGAKPPKKPPTITAPVPKKAAAPKADGSNKTQMLIAMMTRPGGANSKEMEAATGWAPHSVRGLIGTLKKKGVVIVSKKLKNEATIYCITQAPKASEPADVI